MKTILKTTMVSLITLLFINCNNSNSKVVSQTNEPSNKLEKYKIIDISKSEYEKLLSSAFKFDLDTSLLVKKNEGTIKLALDNGSFKTFSDTLVNTDNADTKEYFYK